MFPSGILKRLCCVSAVALSSIICGCTAPYPLPVRSYNHYTAVDLWCVTLHYCGQGTCVNVSTTCHGRVRGVFVVPKGERASTYEIRPFFCGSLLLVPHRCRLRIGRRFPFDWADLEVLRAHAYRFCCYVLLCFEQVKFEIPYFTVSGIQVRYLKIIEKSGYQALPWVR